MLTTTLDIQKSQQAFTICGLLRTRVPMGPTGPMQTTHSLLENKLGTIKYKIFPSWKNEGYCDFIANESSYDEQEGLSWICNKKENSNNPSFKYFKYRLITDYLFKERKISMEEFLTKKFDLDELNEDIKEKYCTQQGVKMH